MEEEEPVRARHPDERRREERVDVGLPEEEPLRVRVGRGRDVHERRPSVHAPLERAPLLQEHALRARRELLPHARQVLATVGQVAVVGEAVRHHVVGGLVALDAERRARHVDRQRDAAVDADDEQRGDQARAHVPAVR